MLLLSANPFPKLRLSTRTLTTLFLCTLLLLLGALNTRHAFHIRPAAAPPLPADPHLSRDQLLCTLEPAGGDGSAPAFRAVMTNLHPSTTVSVLLPGSPFADDAVARGAFEVRESGPLGARVVEADATAGGGGRVIEFDGDDFVEILPFHAMTKEVHLGPLAVRLRGGRNYTVQARGRWRAVWHARLEDYDPGYLEKLGGGTGLIDWSYTSNALEVALK
jgi:hypothetical protein